MDNKAEISLAEAGDDYEEEEIVARKDPNQDLKNAIWAYFLLLIFEGALRKWFLPWIASPLLVVRDPIAVWMIYIAWKRGLFPSTAYLYSMVVIGLVGFFTAMFVGHGNLIIALFGARILLFHYPLIFIIGRVFNREDILKMANWTLYIAGPMALLISMQFYSPQSAWVNRGLAGDTAGAGFSGSGDFFRPPGTFSFTNGTTLFFNWLAPFVMFFWFNLKKVNIWVLLVATGALMISIPFSISRSLFFGVCLTLVFAVIATLRKPENMGKIFMALIAGVVVLAVLSQTKFFQTATGAFTDRFTTANDQEGGLVKGVIGDRFVGGLFSSLASSAKQDFFGYGIGMGTNVGSMLMTGEKQIIIAEDEWGRIIGELGPLMGLLVIFFRIGLTFKVTGACYQRLVAGDLLPWMLLSIAFLILSQGGWSQPTNLGFYVMVGGLTLASLKGETAV